MIGRITTACLAVACSLVAAAAEPTANHRSDPAVAPDTLARQTAALQAGVGEIRIGYFGPHDPADPLGGDAWRAALAAVGEANRHGGYRGLPFRLVPAWSKDPWGTGVKQVVRLVYTDRVWAIVGGIDGATTHLAEQVVAKAQLPLVSPAGTDRTANLAHVPWLFSCLPGDHLQAPLLVKALARSSGSRSLVLASADDHDSHMFARELKKRLAERRMTPRFHFAFRRSEPDLGPLAAEIIRSEPGVVVVIAGGGDSARLVAALRQRGFSGPIFGGPWMGRRAFLEKAHAAAEGVVFPLLYDPPQSGRPFAEDFTARFGHRPDYPAAHTHDAVRLVIAAIRKAGLDREAIRDALGELSPWVGVTGTVKWDARGGNTRAVRLGTIKAGRVEPL